ncbi:C-C motif chemokine 20b [Dunckerocampus dactyliophorus]|uniref:C-C motif chemokine 20b n=1 Tax=Dunckerocampus dactyliophorus TaxID=161453 RepID=UPI002406BB63|nr:C-C motif chemokine 20b [Dunckerocampus dactyliophorus]
MEGRKVYILTALLVLMTFTGRTHSASCCLGYSVARLPCKKLLGYTIQSMGKSCDINAVIFHLRRKFLCADPSKDSTQRGMRCIDERRRKSTEATQRMFAANMTTTAA